MENNDIVHVEHGTVWFVVIYRKTTRVACVDLADWEAVSQHRWCASFTDVNRIKSLDAQIRPNKVSLHRF